MVRSLRQLVQLFCEPPYTVYMTDRKDRLNNKFLSDSAAYAHLRALDPELPDALWGIIVRYHPKVSLTQWKAVREFTIATAVQMKPRSYESTRRLMTMTARFHSWLWAATGSELTAERVYTSRNVYRYLQEFLPTHSESHRWGIVRQLGTIADLLANGGIKRLPAPHLPGRRPFSLADSATMHSWAASLTTNLKRQNAWAILGLAGGAGLRTDEIIDVRLGDIEMTDGRVFVNVPGPRPRRVPVMNPWNRTLLRSLDQRTNPDEFLFCGYRSNEYRPTAIQTFLTLHPSRVRATVSRLRSTWIVSQIDNGLPLPVLKAIAGFASAQSLDKHLRYAKPLNLADYIGLITGEEVAR
ncbi:site-specific integrase [Cryobacterium sp. TMT1-3]|nr:site-specific integrase [Cryobacterium sp. TMT1-3]